MQITIEISEQLAEEAAARGLSAEAYANELLSGEHSSDSFWEAEAMRGAEAIDMSQTKLVPWEQIESRLRAGIAG
jgi:hypothetical protein